MYIAYYMQSKKSVRLDVAVAVSAAPRSMIQRVKCDSLTRAPCIQEGPSQSDLYGCIYEWGVHWNWLYRGPKMCCYTPLAVPTLYEIYILWSSPSELGGDRSCVYLRLSEISGEGLKEAGCNRQAEMNVIRSTGITSWALSSRTDGGSWIGSWAWLWRIIPEAFHWDTQT